MEKAIKYSEEINWPWLISQAWTQSGNAYYLLGDLETAKMHAEKGHSIYSNTLIKYSGSLSLIILSAINHDSEELLKALNYIKKALKLSVENNGLDLEAWSRIMLGRILGKINKSNTSEAEDYILEGIRLNEELALWNGIALGYFFLGELYANIEQKDKAAINLNKALTMYQKMENQYYPDKIQEILHRL